MTPTEILAAAKDHPVGPMLPARREWLEGWTGNATARISADHERHGRRARDISIVVWDGDVLSGEDIFTCGEPGIFSVREDEYSAILIDTLDPAVRDHLIRLNVAPDWARDNPAAVWAAGMGVGVTDSRGPWSEDRWVWFRNHEIGSVRTWVHKDGEETDASWDGWALGRPSMATPCGPETGEEGKACADLAALRAGCVLEEPDGWFVPLGDGGVGWFAREATRV